MTRPQRAFGLLAAIAATMGLTWLSHVSIASGQPAEGTLRLAWRARPERIETCQEQNSEALAALPTHMRQPVICEGQSASYRLRVQVSGQVLADRIVRPGGLRGDRPLYVLLEFPAAPGDADVRVSLARVEQPATAAGEAGGSPSSGAAVKRLRDDLSEALPPSLVYERRLHFAPRQVRLITYDPAGQTLVDVQAPPR